MRKVNYAYVICPVSLLMDRSLTSFSKEVYLYIKNKHNIYKSKSPEGKFFESMESIANEFNVAERTVRRAIDLLCEKGWLEKQSGGQRGTLILHPNDDKIVKVQ